MTKKIGLSKVRPFNPDVRQGPKLRAGKPKKLTADDAVKKAVADDAGPSADPIAAMMTLQPTAENSGHPDAAFGKVTSDANSGARKDSHMTLALKGLNKKGNAAIYSGLKHPVRFPLANFTDKQAPATLDLTGPFAVPAVKEPKVKLTAEERKAARAAKPKPTLAEKAAKLEAQAAKLRAQAAEAPAEM